MKIRRINPPPRRQEVAAGRPPRGFTITELIIVLMVGSLFFAILFRIVRSFTTQGVQMDQRTTGWHAYGRVSDQLRFDLKQAVEVRVPDSRSLALKTVSLGPDLQMVPSEIVWRQRDERTIIRIEAGSERVFDFSGALDRGRFISLQFRTAP